MYVNCKLLSFSNQRFNTFTSGRYIYTSLECVPGRHEYIFLLSRKFSEMYMYVFVQISQWYVV